MITFNIDYIYKLSNGLFCPTFTMTLTITCLKIFFHIRKRRCSVKENIFWNRIFHMLVCSRVMEFVTYTEIRNLSSLSWLKSQVLRHSLALDWKSHLPLCSFILCRPMHCEAWIMRSVNGIRVLSFYFIFILYALQLIVILDVFRTMLECNVFKLNLLYHFSSFYVVIKSDYLMTVTPVLIFLVKIDLAFYAILREKLYSLSCNNFIFVQINICPYLS